VRGLAVVAVVAYHLGFGWARGGYLGVDTFLVLSGYLITAGLLSEHAKSGYVRLRAFWARRARRLVPALMVLLVAVGLYASIAALPDEARSLRLDSASALGFWSNWRFILTSQGYFGQSAAPSLLRHTWSLGVEAQLYLLWPILVIAVLGRWGRRPLLVVAALMAVMSSGSGMVLAARSGGFTPAYYGTETRAAAFLLGAVVATFLAGRAPAGQRPPGPQRRWTGLGWAGIGGLALTLGLWWSLPGTSRWLFRGGLPLAASASALMIIDVAVNPLGLTGRLFSASPLRLLGRVSYGIYLWHWPLVLVLTQRRTGLSGTGLLAVRLAAIASAVTLSWLLVERPLLRHHSRPSPAPSGRRLRWRPVLGMAASIAVVVTILISARPGGVGSPAAASRIVTAQPISSPQLVRPPGPVAANTSAVKSPPVVLPPARIQAVMLGDSVSVTLANALERFAPTYNVSLADGGIVGCGIVVGNVRSNGQASPIPNQCWSWRSEWERQIDISRPHVVVLLLGRWEVLDRVIDGQWHHIGQPLFDGYLAGQLDQAIMTAQRGGATVVMCTAPYYQGLEPPQGGMWPENDPARVDRFNQLVVQTVSRHPGVVLFDLHALVSPAGHFASVIGGAAVRSSDGVHFAPDAGPYIAPRLFPVITSAAPPGPVPSSP